MNVSVFRKLLYSFTALRLSLQITISKSSGLSSTRSPVEVLILLTKEIMFQSLLLNLSFVKPCCCSNATIQHCLLRPLKKLLDNLRNHKVSLELQFDLSSSRILTVLLRKRELPLLKSDAIRVSWAEHLVEFRQTHSFQFLTKGFHF